MDTLHMIHTAGTTQIPKNQHPNLFYNTLNLPIDIPSFIIHFDSFQTETPERIKPSEFKEDATDKNSL